MQSINCQVWWGMRRSASVFSKTNCHLRLMSSELCSAWLIDIQVDWSEKIVFQKFWAEVYFAGVLFFQSQSSLSLKI